LSTREKPSGKKGKTGFSDSGSGKGGNLPVLGKKESNAANGAKEKTTEGGVDP